MNMGIFSRKRLNSNEYEDLNKKLIAVVTSLDLMESKVYAMTTNMNSLRGLVNRKFGNYDEEDVKEKPLKSSDGLDELRILAKKDGGSDQTGRNAPG